MESATFPQFLVKDTFSSTMPPKLMYPAVLLKMCSLSIPPFLSAHKCAAGSKSPSLAIRLQLLSQQYDTAIITVGMVIEQHWVQRSTLPSINETIRVNESYTHISIAKQISKWVQLWLIMWDFLNRCFKPFFCYKCIHTFKKSNAHLNITQLS